MQSRRGLNLPEYLDLPEAQALRGRDFLCVRDLTEAELRLVFRVAEDLKARQKAGHPHPWLAGKSLGLVFQKASTRTRVSFEVGMYQLGGQSLFLGARDLQLGRGETIADTARVLSRYLDGIMIRTYAQEEVEELARYASVPVINGLTDLLHPCQALADLFTVRERRGELAGLKLAYVGDGNNVAHSLLLAGAKFGMEVRVASPPGYAPRADLVAEAGRLAEATGGRILITEDPRAAAQGADVLYTDVWASMGQEAEAEERRRLFFPYQLNRELVAGAAQEVLVMHCLPAHRGEEITDEVLDGPHSVVWDQAENRLHVQKALLLLLLR
ncbi:MAG: ornithine carbamoyltransferase [Clostridia bacterium]|jgi:ornithine carbamoyltransferase|nr:ornithine carbamoyltransferase [Clostridia bacterium]MDH7572025.1 ornithine carbamoyltransferase [Clostridia bacterium]